MTAKVIPESSGESTTLLVAGETAPAIVANGGSRSPYLIICDHAGRATPRSLGLMGASAEAFDLHIAWDIGAGGVARRMGEMLGACVIEQAYSRLVIDCNRDPDREDAIMAVSDGVRIPANEGLDAADRAARVADIHAPYHRRIAEEQDWRLQHGLETFVVSIHSFTPLMNGVARPWHLGVLHLGDSPLSRAMLAALAERGTFEVGDNQPYAMDGIDYTVPLHAQRRGVDYLELEIRQDLIEDPEGQTQMAKVLCERLEAARAGL